MVNRLTLEKIRKTASKLIGRSTIDDMQFKFFEVPGIEGWVYEISTQLLATKLADDTYTAYFYYKTPSTWFQMFKKSHYPKWLLNKYPVKYTNHKSRRTIKFTRYETYPMANIAVPKDQRTIELLGYERPINDVVWDF